MECAAFLEWGGIGTDAVVPPPAFTFSRVRRELYEEPALPIIFFLIPFTDPRFAVELSRFESPILIGISSVALFIQSENDRTAVFVFPFPLPEWSDHRREDRTG